MVAVDTFVVLLLGFVTNCEKNFKSGKKDIQEAFDNSSATELWSSLCFASVIAGYSYCFFSMIYELYYGKMKSEWNLSSRFFAALAAAQLLQLLQQQHPLRRRSRQIEWQTTPAFFARPWDPLSRRVHRSSAVTTWI